MRAAARCRSWSARGRGVRKGCLSELIQAISIHRQFQANNNEMIRDEINSEINAKRYMNDNFLNLDILISP